MKNVGFIGYTYNVTDMMWVGKAGSSAVAAVGTAGFFPWLAMAFINISKIGGEVKVAQSIGDRDVKSTKSFIKAAIEINIILSVLYTSFLITFNNQLIGFFRLGELEVITMSKQYLVIVALGMIFYFINPVFTAIFNGLGNSKAPFKINTIGLITNIILDPVLIMGLGGFPKLGVVGAAIATVIAQMVVTISFLIMIIRNKNDYFKVKLFRNIEAGYYNVLIKLGFPVAVQSGMFTIFAMLIGVVVAAFGPVAIAVQKVGSQIESISWMTAEGLAVALGSFVGQNYGAKEYERINKGCRITLIIAMILGVINTIILVFFGKYIFSAFIQEADAIKEGTMYLKILGYSQLFMCLEIITTGAFKGLGRTLIPSFIITVLTGARVPAAYFLSKSELLGIDGIWWSISLSSILKGILMLSIFTIMLKFGKLYGEYKKEKGLDECIQKS